MIVGYSLPMLLHAPGMNLVHYALFCIRNIHKYACMFVYVWFPLAAVMDVCRPGSKDNRHRQGQRRNRDIHMKTNQGGCNRVDTPLTPYPHRAW